MSLTSSLDLIRVLVVMLISAGFLQAFWSRLVTTLAPVRSLGFQEALGIVLMLAILFGS